MDTDKFNYVYSCDLDINVQLKMWVLFPSHCFDSNTLGLTLNDMQVK